MHSFLLLRIHEIPEVSEWRDIPRSFPGVIMETPSLNCNPKSEIREVHCTRKDTEVERSEVQFISRW